MRHNVYVPGRRFALRPVDERDAALICALRARESAAAFLNQGASTVQAQLQWLDRYFERAGDYYFMIVDQRSGTCEGTAGLYDVDHEARRAEWGRWVLRPGSIAAVESALLIYRCAFDVLDLETVYCRTLVDNRQVVSFHDSSGLTRVDEQADVIVNGVRCSAVEHRLDRASWAAVEQRLAPTALRLALR